MRKSFTKRIKITKTGKVMRKTMGQGHCRAKKSSVQLRRKMISQPLSLKKKTIDKYIRA